MIPGKTLPHEWGVTRQTINSIEKGRFHSQPSAGIQNCPRLCEANCGSVYPRGYLREKGCEIRSLPAHLHGHLGLDATRQCLNPDDTLKCKAVKASSLTGQGQLASPRALAQF